MTKTLNREIKKFTETHAVKENKDPKDFKVMYAQNILTGEVMIDRRTEKYWQVSFYGVRNDSDDPATHCRYPKSKSDYG